MTDSRTWGRVAGRVDTCMEIVISVDTRMVMSFQLETERRSAVKYVHLTEKDKMMRRVCRIRKSPSSPISQERTVNCLVRNLPYTSSSVFVCKYRYKHTPIFIERDTCENTEVKKHGL